MGKPPSRGLYHTTTSGEGMSCSSKFPHDTFSLISYIYRKVPDPGEFPKVEFRYLGTYPFSYPNLAHTTYFIIRFQLVTAENFSSKKFQKFFPCDSLPVATELPPGLPLPSAWPWGVFYIYTPASLTDRSILLTPRSRAPPGHRLHAKRPLAVGDVSHMS